MAEDLEAGNAYLNLMASARDLQRDVDSKVKKVKAPDVVAKIDAQIGDLEAKAAKARATIESIRAKAADPQIGLDISELDAKAGLVRAQLERLRAMDATPKVDADIAAAEAKLGRFESKMAALEAKRSTVQVDADVARAEAQISGFESKIRRLESQRATITIAEQGAAATGAVLDAVDSKRRRVDGSNASISIAASGGAQASGMLGALVAGLSAVLSIAPAAGAAVAGALAAASAGGQALGAVKAGFSGIGDAIKAVESDEKTAATSSAGAASSRVSSANQIAGAQAGVAAAVRNQTRASITGSEQVADAARAEARAAVTAGRARITAGQQVAAASRAVADAVVAAGQRSADAERSVGRAQDSARYAQESLTRARRDAVAANEELTYSVAGAAIAERRAQLALRKARESAAAEWQTGDQEELQLNIDEAANNLDEVRFRYGKLKAEQAQFARTGVDGTDQVVSAQRALRDSQAGVADAVRASAQAQRDGARQVADAVLAASQARQQAAWQVQDAEAGVADASRATGRAARDSAWQQQDAADGVVAAQRALQSALDSTATAAGGAGAAGKKSAFELAQLTPAGRSYVDFWTKEWKPAVQATTDAVAGQMLPRMETAQRNLLGLQPLFADGFSQTGAVIGDLAIRGSQMVSTGPWRADFAAIMASNNRALGSWGNAGLSALEATRALTVAGLPLSERLARVADYSMQGVESFLLQKEASGELAQFMDFAGQKVGQLVSVSGDLIGAGYQVAVALAPVGSEVLDLVGGTAALVGEFAKANPGLVQFIAVSGIAIATVNGLAKATVALQAGYGIMTGGLKTLAGVVSTALVPSNLAATRGFQAFTDWGQRAGLAASTLTQGLTGSATAGTVAQKTISGTTNVMSKLGSALPLIGVGLIAAAAANDALNTSFDEGVEKWSKGGQAARDLTAELAANTVASQQASTAAGGYANLLGYDWVRQHVFGIETTESFNRKLEESRAKMSELQRAQQDATRAQGEYEFAVRTFGANSGTAQLALQNLGAATRDVEIKQIAVRNATDQATASMLYQAQQTMGTLNADLAKQQSLLQIEQAQKTYNDAVKNNGPASLEARSAYVQYEQSLLTGIASVQQAAQKQYELEGRTDAAAQAQRDADLAALNMANTIKGNIPDALARYIGSMDAGRLSAIGARVKTDEFGHSVVMLPNGKAVPISAPGAVQARDEVNGLRDAIDRLQRMGTVTIPMQVAGGAPTGPDLRNPTGNGQVPIFRGYARGGPVGFPAGGPVSGPGSSTSDSIDARLSNGEYVIKASAVRAVGVPALDAINRLGYAKGGLVGYARGGPVAPQAAPVASGSAAVAAAVVAPVGDPAAAQAAAGATDELTASMTAAQAAAALLDPALVAVAATQTGLVAPATAAVTAGQQQLVATGIVPLVGSMLSTLFPTLGVYQQQVGGASVGANQALQGAQGMTQASTSATATNTAVNAANMATSTTNMSLINQGQLANLRFGQGMTQQSTTATALNTAGNNSNMIATTANMSATNQGHLTSLRGAQGVTSQATTAFADAWRAQLGRTMPDSGNPLRWVINVPIRSVTEAWNNLDAQFALGKRVNPYIAPFAQGGIHEDHRATITRSGGPIRMWSEPETGGEAYIPMARSKRPRSERILDAVAGRFGKAVVPQGDPALFADGGVTAFADGGLWRRLGGVAQQLVPGTSVSSGYRPGDPGYHGRGQAADLVGNLPLINRTIAQAYPNSSQLIYTPGINLFQGRPHTYNAATRADHFDHVHWAMQSEAMLNGAPGMYSGAAGGGAAFDPTPMIDAAFAKTYREIADVPKFFGPSPQVARDQGVAKFAADQVKAKATADLMAKFADAAMGATSDEAPGIVKIISDVARSRFGGLARKAAITGTATGLVESNLRNIPGGDRDSLGVFQQRPSQGWGTPAQIMNVTYAAGKFFSRFPGNWAAMDQGQLAQSVQRSAFPLKYGQRMGQAASLVAQYGAFDQGGMAYGKGVMLKDVITPERVLNPVETRSYNTLEHTLGRNGMRIDTRDLAAPGPDRPGIEIHVHPRAQHDEGAVAAAVERRLAFALMT